MTEDRRELQVAFRVSHRHEQVGPNKYDAIRWDACTPTAPWVTRILVVHDAAEHLLDPDFWKGDHVREDPPIDKPYLCIHYMVSDGTGRYDGREAEAPEPLKELLIEFSVTGCTDDLESRIYEALTHDCQAEIVDVLNYYQTPGGDRYEHIP